MHTYVHTIHRKQYRLSPQLNKNAQSVTSNPRCHIKPQVSHQTPGILTVPSSAAFQDRQSKYTDHMNLYHRYRIYYENVLYIEIPLYTHGRLILLYPYIHTLIHTYVHMYVGAYIHTYIYIHSNIHAYISTYICYT